MEELRSLTLEGVSDELQRPSEEEEGKSVDPQPVDKDGGQEEHERDDNCRNAESMAGPVYRMLMAARVLRDPLFVRASA